jgi:hypothetical protein
MGSGSVEPSGRQSVLKRDPGLDACLAAPQLTQCIAEVGPVARSGVRSEVCEFVKDRLQAPSVTIHEPDDPRSVHRPPVDPAVRARTSRR